MKISSAFPSKYLRAADIPDGQKVTVRIDHVEMENVAGNDSPDEHKPVLYFVGKQKGMVLNKTNSNTISMAYGDDTDLWVNKPLGIFATETSYQGKMMPCLRVSIPKPSMIPAGAMQAKVAAAAAVPVPPPFEEGEQQFAADDIPF